MEVVSGSITVPLQCGGGGEGLGRRVTVGRGGSEVGSRRAKTRRSMGGAEKREVEG